MKRKSILFELKDYIWEQKAWWIAPIIVTLFLAGTLIILAQSTPVSPFIYALF